MYRLHAALNFDDVSPLILAINALYCFSNQTTLHFPYKPYECGGLPFFRPREKVFPSLLFLMTRTTVKRCLPYLSAPDHCSSMSLAMSIPGTFLIRQPANNMPARQDKVYIGLLLDVISLLPKVTQYILKAHVLFWKIGRCGLRLHGK